MTDPSTSNGPRDFDFLVGRWNVRHHRLRRRLAGCTDWDHFDGTSHLWRVLDGFGNVDDGWLDLPGGAYRALTVRSFDPATRQWAIWWLDHRHPHQMDVPMKGGFGPDGIGRFLADDRIEGRPIRVRFVWSHITPRSARWEQAFSEDGGATWEVNWVMDFERADG